MLPLFRKPLALGIRCLPEIAERQRAVLESGATSSGRKWRPSMPSSPPIPERSSVVGSTHGKPMRLCIVLFAPWVSALGRVGLVLPSRSSPPPRRW